MARIPPLDRWHPPSEQLPEPHSHIQLIERLMHGGGRVVWRVRSARHTDDDKQSPPIIVEFVFDDEASQIGSGDADPRSGRFAFQPNNWQTAGWSPIAIVTPLPAMLASPYERFRLIDFIGLGGMGQVWLAEDADTPNLLLAIKFLRNSSITDTDASFQQFHTEAKAGIDLSQDSRYFVQTRHFLDLRQSHPLWPPAALVMEYVEPSLARVIHDCKQSSKRLPMEIASELASGILHAGRELHTQHHRVHRDIKPSNIMIRLARGRHYYDADSIPEALYGAHAVLSDLGTICRIGEKSWFVLGQDGWKAPELFTDGDCKSPNTSYVVHPAEDMHAIGRVLESLAAVVEEPATFLTDVAAQLCQAEATRRSSATPELILQVSPHWPMQLRLLRESGWKPQDHEDFVGRAFVFEAFDAFRAGCRVRGGIFLIVGEAGVGKTALLSRCVGRGGPHPAFFYRYREGRTTPADMPEVLIRMLCDRYRVEEPSDGRSQKYGERLEVLLQRIVAEKLTPDGSLLLVIDGLDEASSPEQATQMLPKSLPRGVFCIVASRPPAAGKDHLASLVSAGAKRFDLRGSDQENLSDVELFLTNALNGIVDKNGNRLRPDDAMEIARNAGGTFQLLRYWIEDIAAGRMAIREALERPEDWAGLSSADRIFAWYRESWQRITAGLSLDEQDRLVDFACLMAAVQSPISEHHILSILNWRGSHLDWAKSHLAWLMTRTVESTNSTKTAYLQLRHQSINDFLTSVEHEGPARHDLPEMHARIGNYGFDVARRKGWQQVDPYGRFFTVRHLLEARTAETVTSAIACLTDLEYLQATLGDQPPGADE